MKDVPGDDYVHENDVICDYSVASSTPTKSSKEGDSVEQALNQEDNKENIALVDADDIERHTIKMYRRSLADETFAEKVAAGLAVELPPTLVGPSPNSKEEKELRLKDLRERVERKAHERQAKSEAKGLDSVIDPRGTPVMNFGEPLKWIPSKKFKRRPMVASLPVWKSTRVSGAPDNSSLSHFSAMTRPCWPCRAVRNQHRHAIEQAARRWRGGRTRRKILIFTQVATEEGPRSGRTGARWR